MSPPYTNLYDWTMHRYWFDYNFLNQTELRFVNYPIKDGLAFTQNRTVSWSLHSLYISHLFIYLFLII